MPTMSAEASHDALPTAVANWQECNIESDEFGALHERQDLYAWAAQGSYFKATNATFGTGIGAGIQASFSATANLLLMMRNGSNTVRVIPHYIRLINTVAGASTTSSKLAIGIDSMPNRYASGGTDLRTQMYCTNSRLNRNSALTLLRAAAITGTASTSIRYTSNVLLKTAAAPCWTIGDEVKIYFGNNEFVGEPVQHVVSGTAAVSIQKYVAPVVLTGSNHTMSVHMWNVANATTAPSWEFEIAWWER